jgi:condensin complex subunit 3
MGKTLPSIFNEVQNSVANHHKNATALRTLHLRAATDEASQLLFEEKFLEMLSRVISVRKDEPNIDKTLQFVIGYIHLLYEFSKKVYS